MGRKLLGYRVRGMHDESGMYLYLHVSAWEWRPGKPPLPHEDKGECVRVKNATCSEFGISDAKIVAVYLKTNEYTSTLASKHTLEDLSDFNRAVVEEIGRRGIDAIVEPEDFGGMPTTIRFRTPNGGFVWIPIFAFLVVDGPKEERAKKTVDRMLDGIARLASSLSPCKENTTEVLQSIRERAQSIETHFRDFTGTKQPHSAKGAIKDFVAIVDDEIAKRSVVIP